MYQEALSRKSTSLVFQTLFHLTSLSIKACWSFIFHNINLRAARNRNEWNSINSPAKELNLGAYRELNSELSFAQIYQIIIAPFHVMSDVCFLSSDLYRISLIAFLCKFFAFTVITLKQNIRETTAITIIKSYICGTTAESLSSKFDCDGNEGDDFSASYLAFRFIWRSC